MEAKKHTKKYLFGLACIHGHIDIIEYLLKKDIIFETYISTSFGESCRNGVLNIAKYLANFGEIDNYDISKALIMTSRYGHEHVIEWLLDTYPIFNDDDDYDNAFAEACGSRLDIVEYLVSRQPDIVKHNHQRAFYIACLSNHLDIVKWLIANVYVAGTAIFPTRNGDITQECFKNACRNGNLEIAQLILNTYPAVQVGITGPKFFADAGLYNDFAIVQWLLQSNDIEANIDIQVAFKYACYNGRVRVTRFLLETYDIDIHANSDDIFIYTTTNSDRTSIIEDARRVIAISRKKSARF